MESELYERVARAELACAMLSRALMDAVQAHKDAIARKTQLEADNALLTARIDALEHRNRACRLDKAEQIHRAATAERRLHELSCRPDLSGEVRDLEAKLKRVRLDSAEHIARAVAAERRAQQLEESASRIAELEAAVAYLERKHRHGLDERAARLAEERKKGDFTAA